MADPVVWEDLPKSQVDNTTIDEAIAAGIATHDADPEAHLQALASLEAHRTNEILDALAESVVNDKLAVRARAYVAIVDASSETDFDSVQSAVEYAVTKGGGTVLITPGEYYLSGEVDLPMNVNLLGVDVESVIVHGGYTGGNYFRPQRDLVDGQGNQYIERITFVNDGGGVFKNNTSDLTSVERIRFNDCRFEGGGTYLRVCQALFTFTSCELQVGGAAALLIDISLSMSSCTITRYSTENNVIVRDTNPDYGEIVQVTVDHCQFLGGAATNCDYFPIDTIEEFSAQFSTFQNWDTSSFDCPIGNFDFNVVGLKSGVAFTYFSSQTSGRWIGNTFVGGATPNLVLDGTNLLLIGNRYSGEIENNSASNIIVGNDGRTPYVVGSTSTTACELGSIETLKFTPNSTRTLTTTVPPAGQRACVIILTSGTTSYTITFGTGFKSTGTLATGAVSSRVFVINFISDGTNLYECSRTAAMVA